MSEEILGVIDEIIFSNEENGFVIATLNADEEEVYIKGYMPMINVGDSVKIRGKLIDHPVYGEQVNVEHVEILLPSTKEEILAYLSSGAITGIKSVTAKMLVDEFGEDIFNVIVNEPEKLLRIPGVGPKKMTQIVEGYKEQIEMQEVIMFFQKYDISLSLGTKIYKEFGEDAIKKISENPYILADHINGIGFAQADKIAKKMGVEHQSPYRLESGIKYVLTRETSSGNTFVYKSELIRRVAGEIGVKYEEIEAQIPPMVISNALNIEQLEEDQGLYIPSMYYSEVHVAHKLTGIASEKFSSKDIDLDIEEYIKDYEVERGIKFAEMQVKAIKESFESGVFIITGGPGTGKTTIINCIIDIYEKVEKKVLLAAPTGRAAKRMSEATIRESKTIHRLLEYQGNIDEYDSGFMRNETNPLECDVLIIDETSMIDIVLMYRLLDAVDFGMRIIFVGDADQLPSVGPGNVLKDMLESEMIPKVVLQEIYRQAEESMIVVNAHKINKGQEPVLNSKDKDFFFIGRSKPKSIVEEVRELCKSRLPNYYGVDSMKDIQVLSIMKKGETGVNNLNTVLQNSLNPKEEGKAEKQFGDRIFRNGDKVMQIKNNYEVLWTSDNGPDGQGVFNGDIGYIKNIDDRRKTIEIKFDDRYVDYSYGMIDELTHSYACTVHKSQGSEFPVIVMPISFGPEMLMNRNIIYTAITRARDLVILVGEKKYLNRMIMNTNETKRNSLLKSRLINEKNGII